MIRQQRWAKGALERVMAAHGTGDEAKYKTLCMGTPALLQQSGLAQGLAFLWARDKELGKRFLTNVAQVYDPSSTGEKAGRKLLDQVLEIEDLSRYMALTTDIIDVTIWFRRFAQAELHGESTEETP